ncbi:MmyB family transcriptional regulator [Nocardia vaccinii]|uniref:MmyB family transcriptional regulator n=1 Tax=Nocardia vaccinii TaxID=1822 RepID=UPI0008348076|nr:transcriptional regulator [Nocardia vaccinii]
MHTEHGEEYCEPGTVICMACWTRDIREYRNLSRPRSHAVTGVSTRYLKDIEYGHTIPGPNIIESLITGYQLDDAQARLTRDLCQPPGTLPPAHELRERITPARRSLWNILDSPLALAYLDPLWNILTANDKFFRIFPGLSVADNLALWALPPSPEPSPAKALLEDHRREARWLVGTLRGTFAHYRDDPRVASLYQQLSRNVIFNHHWHNDIHVAHGRCIDNQPLHMRDPATGQRYTLSVQLTEITDVPEIRGFLFWPHTDDPQ